MLIKQLLTQSNFNKKPTFGNVLMINKKEYLFLKYVSSNNGKKNKEYHQDYYCHWLSTRS